MAIFKKILIGVDSSQYAQHATKVGFDLARESNAAVGLVHVIESGYVATPVADTTLGGTFEPVVNPAVEMEILNVQEKTSDHIIERIIANYGEGLEVTHFTDYGSTADGIVHCSKEFGADLIVIGTHSRTGIDRLLMGSVAENVVRHADVPVLVIPFNAGIVE